MRSTGNGIIPCEGNHILLSQPKKGTGNGIIPCEVNHILPSQPMRAKQSRAGVSFPNTFFVNPVGSMILVKQDLLLKKKTGNLN